MELWIRSQDKTRLVKITQVKFVDKESDLDNFENVIRGYGIDGFNFRLGIYKSKERALEVLDEIQSKIHQTFICKLNQLVRQDDYKRIKYDLEIEYPNNDFIMQPVEYELQNINSNVIVYEMPLD